jgi:hypothetical protein
MEKRKSEKIEEPMAGTQTILNGLFINYFHPKLPLERRILAGINIVRMAQRELLDTKKIPYDREAIKKSFHKIKIMQAQSQATTKENRETIILDILSELSIPISIIRGAMRNTGLLKDTEYTKVDIDTFGVGVRLLGKQEQENPLDPDKKEEDKEEGD